MAGGRPTVYRKEMCEEVLPLFEGGASLASVAKSLGITRETLNKWRNEKPEFSDAILRGLDLSQAWWEEAGQRGLFQQHQGEKINSQIWMLNMKNRFCDDWRDKQELDVNAVINTEAPDFGEDT